MFILTETVFALGKDSTQTVHSAKNQKVFAAPELIKVSVNSNSVAMVLADTSDATYMVQYKEPDKSNWNTIFLKDASTSINNLNPCTNYQVRIKAIYGRKESAYLEFCFTTLKQDANGSKKVTMKAETLSQKNN